MSFLKRNALLVFVALLCTSCYVGIPAGYSGPSYQYSPEPYYQYSAPYPYYPYSEPYYTSPQLGFYFGFPIDKGRGHHRGHGGHWRRH